MVSLCGTSLGKYELKCDFVVSQMANGRSSTNNDYVSENGSSLIRSILFDFFQFLVATLLFFLFSFLLVHLVASS